jgi:hypothetical protein
VSEVAVAVCGSRADPNMATRWVVNVDLGLETV